MRLIIVVAVLLAGISGGIGVVAAADVAVVEDSEQPVDLTELLKKQTESTIKLVKSNLSSSAKLIDRLLENGVTL